MFILEEVNLPHPWCPQWDMMVTWRVLNERHLSTALCARVAERKNRRLAQEELRESSERAFQAYVAHLKTVTAFRYLGRVMTAGDYDWPAVVVNLQKVSKSWGRLSQILSREGSDPKVSGHFSRH